MSVAQQSYKPLEHLIGIDHALSGVSEMLNRLARGSEGEYLALLADDDLLFPNHLETLVPILEAGADIAYSYCEVRGRDNWRPNWPFDEDLLRQGNYIPATTLIRRSLAEEIGWWRTHSELGHAMEDYDFWMRALDAGAKFQHTEVVTWCYRFHGKNISINNGMVT